jgi:hypothetical protein
MKCGRGRGWKVCVKALSVIGILSFAGLDASRAMAQLNPGAAAAFGEYLSNHGDEAAALRRNPNLFSDRKYLGAHADLLQFLQQHPGFTRTMRNGGPNVTSTLPAVSEMMYRDPALTRDIRRNPNLLSDPKFLARHPRFARYMQAHPEAAPYLTGEWSGWSHPGMRPPDSDDPRDFSRWLHEHPDVRGQLAADPKMAVNPEFLQQHREWAEYLNQHQRLRYRFQNPNWNYANWRRHHRWEDRDDWYERRGDWWADRDEARRYPVGDYDDRHFDNDDRDYGHEHHHDHGHHYGWYKHHGPDHGHGHDRGPGNDND